MAISAEERQKILVGEIRRRVLWEDMRVETLGDYQTVMVKSKPINHILHLLLCIPTLGGWAIVWLILGLLKGEQRFVIEVEEDGSVTVGQTQRGMR